MSTRITDRFRATERDREMIAFAGRHRGAEGQQVAGRFGMHVSNAHRHLDGLVRCGLLEHRRLLHGRPGIYLATRAGLEMVGIDLPPGAARPAQLRARCRARVARHRARARVANIRQRVLQPATVRANARLTLEKRPLIPAGVTPHSLRHTYCSLLIAQGEELPTVAAQMRHADISTTLRVYTHVMKHRREGVAERLDEALWGAENGRDRNSGRNSVAKMPLLARKHSNRRQNASGSNLDPALQSGT
jgi:Phage integrase family/IclR helix-turn-helix domain